MEEVSIKSEIVDDISNISRDSLLEVPDIKQEIIFLPLTSTKEFTENEHKSCNIKQEIPSLTSPIKESTENEYEACSIKNEIVWIEQDGKSDMYKSKQCDSTEELVEGLDPLAEHSIFKRNENKSVPKSGDIEIKYKSLLKQGKINGKYRCTLCSYTSTVHTNFKNHLYKHGPDSKKPFHCELCDFGTCRRSTFDIHLVKHFLKDTVECEICKCEIKVGAGLNRHMQLHEKEKSYKCDICGYATSIKGVFTRHVLFHTNSYNCPHCKYKACSKSYLKIHTAIHKDEGGWL